MKKPICDGDAVTVTYSQRRPWLSGRARKAKRGDLVVGRVVEASQLSERGHVATVQLFDSKEKR